MVINRGVLLVVLALAGHQSHAFAPVARTVGKVAPSSITRFAMVAEDTDVSIEYDGAARLAYTAWCDKYGKDANDAKFDAFKSNYEAITVANVSAAKEARDAGTDRPKDLDLNEYGDMTEAEYMAMQSGGSAAAPAEPAAAPENKGALESAMEASMAQSAASSALSDAADALAEEEEKLAEALGLDSIEDLENAIDAMEGIDVDGGEIDTSDVREARVRSAYMDWCKGYGKTADESRFPTFSSNYLAMEEYANENGREMMLNKYADCTEEEYRQLTEAPAPAPVIEEPVAKEEPKVEVKAPAPGPKVEAKVELKSEPEKKPEVKKPEAKKPEAKKPEAKAKPAPKPAAAKPTPAPKPVPVEPVLSLEEQAIADVKAAAEKEAAFVASRRAIDEATSAIELQKAKDASEKLAQSKVDLALPEATQRSATSPKKPAMIKTTAKKIEAAPAAPAKDPVVALTETKTPAKKEEKQDFFSSLFAPLPAKKAIIAKTGPAKPVVEPVAPKAVEPAPVVKPVAPKVEKKVVAVAPKVEKKVEAKAQAQNPFANIFGAPAKPAAKKLEPEPEVAPPAPKVPPVKKEIDMAPNAMTDALNSFFGGSSSKPAPKPVPVVQKAKPAPKAPAPAPVKPVAEKKPLKGSGTFSLFGGAAAPRPKKAAAPKAVAVVQKPVEKKAVKGSGTFSLFGGSTPKKPALVIKAPVVEKKPPAAKKSAFGGFFGGAAAPKPKAAAPKAPVAAAKPAGTKPVKGSGTFSLFGGSAPKKSAAPVVKAPIVEKKPPAAKKSSSFGGFFGGAAPPKPKKAAPKAAPVAEIKPVEKKVVKGSGGFNFFGGSTPKPKPAPVTKAPVVEKKAVAKQSNSFGGFFGGAAPKKATPKAPVVEEKPAPKKAPTFSLFGGAAAKPKPTPKAATPKAAAPMRAAKKAAPKKAAPKKKAVSDGIPIVSKFSQGKDGSITGIVSNSKNFRTGTKITTSPVKRGAKSGDVVKTSSGSQYRLD